MDADGRNLIRLTDGPRQKLAPDWSPDGQQIAFVSWRAWAKLQSRDIYVVGADGQWLKRVTHDVASQYSPSFSPDGQQFAYYASDNEGFGQIHVVDTNGINHKRHTHNRENHRDPAWSPDGQVIAYCVWEGNDLSTIHMMAADGQYLKQLSDVHGARDSQPDINPLGLAVSLTSKTTATWGRLKKRASNLR